MANCFDLSGNEITCSEAGCIGPDCIGGEGVGGINMPSEWEGNLSEGFWDMTEQEFTEWWAQHYEWGTEMTGYTQHNEDNPSLIDLPDALQLSNLFSGYSSYEEAMNTFLTNEENQMQEAMYNAFSDSADEILEDKIDRLEDIEDIQEDLLDIQAEGTKKLTALQRENAQLQLGKTKKEILSSQTREGRFGDIALEEYEQEVMDIFKDFGLKNQSINKSLAASKEILHTGVDTTEDKAKAALDYSKAVKLQQLDSSSKKREYANYQRMWELRSMHEASVWDTLTELTTTGALFTSPDDPGGYVSQVNYCTHTTNGICDGWNYSGSLGGNSQSDSGEMDEDNQCFITCCESTGQGMWVDCGNNAAGYYLSPDTCCPGQSGNNSGLVPCTVAVNGACTNYPSGCCCPGDC